MKIIGRLIVVLLALLLAHSAFTQVPVVAPYDLLIRNGTVIDGSGRPGFKADVGVRAGRIELVGAAQGASARAIIDAAGLIVAPGFIDAHSHTETAIATPEKRWNEAVIRQGVTTIIGGPDGNLAPAQIRKLIAAYERHGVGTNVAFYVGHNDVRRQVMGGARRLATPEEIVKMRALVREGMELGAVGLSTGLMYEPGMFSNTDEVVELARAVAPFKGIYDSHVRDPSKAFIESDKEAIEIGRRAGIPVKIAHEKATGLHNAGKLREVIAMIEQARAGGHEVVTDQYPYDGAATATLTGIIVVPEQLKQEAGFELKAALRDRRLRAQLKEASEQGINGGFAWIKAVSYTNLRITSSRDYPHLVGKYPSELAQERRLSEFDLLCELILGARHPVGITLGAVKEEDVRELMKQPWNMIASDGNYADSRTTGDGHPRATGTFARVLGHYVREVKLLKLEEAIRKMTSLPADHLGLSGRGRIAAGQAADLAIFDARTIKDRSTWEQPHLLAEGVQHVVVNGVLVLRAGRLTGAAPGRFLKLSR